MSGSYDMTTRRWDANTGEAVGSPLQVLSGFVQTVAISSDGDLIVLGSGDKTVRHWRASTGEAIGEPLRGHEYSMRSVAIAEDDKYIVSGSGYGEIRVGRFEWGSNWTTLARM